MNKALFLFIMFVIYIGSAAIGVLLFGEGGIEHRRLPHELISRESVAPPYFPAPKKSKKS